MAHQEAVTIRAWIREGAMDALETALAQINADIERNALLPFGLMPTVHFARFVVLENADVNGRIVPASLVYASNVDGASATHLEVLAALGNGIDEVWQHCDGYPAATARTRESRIDFLRSHMIASQTFYTNTIGRTVQQARDEGMLREALQRVLDDDQLQRGARARIPDDLAGVMRTAMRNDPALRDMLRGAEGLGLDWHVKEVLSWAGAVVAGIVLLPVAVVVVPVWLIALRMLEIRDASEPPLKLAAFRRGDLAIAEDHVVQNQFSAVGCVKPNALRRVTLRALLAAADFATRHYFNKGDLGTFRPLGLNGVDTIHFAQWIVLDDGYRVLFFSNYDGSLTSYMDDFINKVAWGLNAVFSHGESYPKTRWLVLDGATDEQNFKAFLQKHQIPSQAWYSGYKGSTALNLANNAAIRAGLSGDAYSTNWLERL
jgi:hypothetical protein